MDYKHKKYFETNKETWNKKVAVHAQSEFYDLEAFKSGKSSLKKYEMEALGNVSGKSVLHLQCHFGQDTISWSRLGAQCTGVDISDEAVKTAESLANELEVNAQFICCNVPETSNFISEKFDIVFTSYGVIGWLPDLNPWAQMIAERLKPGGVFYMVEFHPIAWMFDYTKDQPEIRYSYDREEVIYEEYKGTYADENADMISKEYGWNHSLSEVISALIGAGLRLEVFNEYHESPYDIFPKLKETEQQMYKADPSLYPLVFEIKAVKDY